MVKRALSLMSSKIIDAHGLKCYALISMGTMILLIHIQTFSSVIATKEAM